jgi:hypothetical protein
MKSRWRALPVLLIVWSVGGQVGAASVPGPLTGAPAQVRVGDTIDVSGDICPTGLTVTAVRQQTIPSFTKAYQPWLRLDMTAIGLAQTASGVSFHVTAGTARTSLNFQVDCSDSTTSESQAPVAVFPPVGEFWWHAAYDKFVETEGFPFLLTLSTLDCEPGSTATGSLTAPGAHTPFLTSTAIISATGGLEFTMDLPTPMIQGNYTATVTCRTALGRNITNSTPVLVLGTGGRFPATGSGPLLPLVAAALLVAGATLRRSVRRPAR